jgi:hypothetical protein
MYGFDLLDNELAARVATTFVGMVKQTPTLHAYWLELQDRIARVAAEQLALVQVDMDSRARHIHAGPRGPQLRDAVASEVRQAAEVLETGLTSLSRGAQTGRRNGPG